MDPITGILANQSMHVPRPQASHDFEKIGDVVCPSLRTLPPHPSDRTFLQSIFEILSGVTFAFHENNPSAWGYASLTRGRS